MYDKELTLEVLNYFDVNAEAIFDVCKTKIKPLVDAIREMIKYTK